MVIWIIGLSGAGKTTVARHLIAGMRAEGRRVLHLDGDILREVWITRPGHDLDGRRQNAEQISRLCKALDQEGIDIVASVLSIFPQWQAWNREHLTDYREVYLSAPMDTLRRRDNKGIYAKADAGLLPNVVGIDIPFEAPPHADMEIDNSDDAVGPGEIAMRIWNELRPTP